MRHISLLLGAASALAFAAAAQAQNITIATVNNDDMIRMQGLTGEFNAAHPDIKVNWVTLEENILRERVTTDIATQGGQYDVVTIGNYEVPIWAKQGWLVPLNDLPADYDVDDLLPAIRGGLTVDDTLYAVPFYGELAMIMYRTDLFEAAGLEMPESPTWEFIGEAARKVTDRSADINGICLRGKAGWGENMAFVTALANSYGARWFDEELEPAVRLARVEGGAAVLRRPDEGRRPRRRLVERLQREPDAVPAGQVRHVDRRHRRRVVRHRPDELDRRRQGRLRALPRHRQRQPRQLAVVVEPRDPGELEERRRRQDLHLLGDLEGLHRPRRRQGRLGRRASGHPHLALRERRVPGRGALRRPDARRDERRRHHQAVGAAGALYRRPVRRDPRVPGDRHHRRPAVLGGRSPASPRSTTRWPRPSRSPRARCGAPATPRADVPPATRPPGPPGGAFPIARTRPAPARRGRSPWRPGHPEHSAAHALPRHRPPPRLDDRAAGDDALLLLPELQPPEPRPGQLGRLVQLRLLLHRPRLLPVDLEHADPRRSASSSSP